MMTQFWTMWLQNFFSQMLSFIAHNTHSQLQLNAMKFDAEGSYTEFNDVYFYDQVKASLLQNYSVETIPNYKATIQACFL